MDGKDIVKLAADFAVGGITAEVIKEQYGDGVLSSVLGIAGGVGAGFVTNKILDSIDEETGIVSDLGSLVDDVLGIF